MRLRARGRRPRMSVEMVVVVTVGALAVVGRLMTVVTTVTGRYLWTSGGADPYLPLAAMPQLLQADIRPGESFVLADLPLWVRLLCATPALLSAAMAAVATALLVGVLRRVAAGEAFGLPVRRRLAAIGLVLVIGGLLQGVVDAAAIAAVVAVIDSAVVMGLGTQVPSFPWTLIVVGVAVTALTAAFSQGARLAEDAVGVV